MGRLQPCICLILLAVMPAAAAAQTGAPDFPFHFQSFFSPSHPLLFLFLLSVKEAQTKQCGAQTSRDSCAADGCEWEAGVPGKCHDRSTAAPTQKTTARKTTVAPAAPPTTSRPPSLLTRDIKILGEDCSLAKWGNDDVWTYEGNTADGRPYYKNEGSDPLGLNYRAGVFYLYYDANCDGKTGAAHSTNGHPQWVMSNNKPSLTSAYDLQGDGRCVGDILQTAMYSIEATFDWTFTFGKVNSACPHVLSDPNWDTSDSYGGLVGCPEPQPSYTLEWGGWASTDGEECGGTDMRTQIEVCADSSPEKDCPCKGRRDPAIPLQSETRLQAKCATTVTTSTSTTTTTTTTTSSSIETQAKTSSSSTSSSSSSSSSPPQSPPTSPGTPQGATAAPIAQDSSNSSDIFGHNETKPGSDASATPAASKDESEGGDGRSDDDSTATDGTTTDTVTSTGTGGGTTAAVIMGALAVVGLVVGIFTWRSNKRSANAYNEPVAAHFRNRAFAPTSTTSITAGTRKVGAAAATTPLQQPAPSTLYAIPMETDAAASASSASTTAAVASGQVMYVSALNPTDPKYVGADASALYTVISKPSRNDGGNNDAVVNDDGRYSGYEPPPGSGSSVEYATPAADDDGKQQVHYDLARQDTIVNHYDLPAPGRRRTKRHANQLQSEA